jgi:hypothetical protein
MFKTCGMRGPIGAPGSQGTNQLITDLHAAKEHRASHDDADRGFPPCFDRQRVKRPSLGGPPPSLFFSSNEPPKVEVCRRGFAAAKEARAEFFDMSAGAPESGIVHHKYRQFQVVGRLKPSAVRGTRKADIYKMNVFADNEVQAKSRFWYYMSMLNRVKKANGEILQINEVFFLLNYVV